MIRTLLGDDINNSRRSSSCDMPPGINRMGIHGLAKVIADHAPKAIKENVIGQYFGRKVAIDASMSIYQFLIAVRMESANSNNVAGGAVLTNDAGETTSHLMGIFYRTIRMMEHGIKPVYVFDGAPPPLKSGEVMEKFGIIFIIEA